MPTSAAIGLRGAEQGWCIVASKWHGGKWIRKAKRERIHRRDQWRCVWCTRHTWPKSIADREGRALACLDHVHPRSAGGGNHHGNLVTACEECNKRRGATDALAFAGTFAGTDAVLARLIRAMGSELPK